MKLALCIVASLVGIAVSQNCLGTGTNECSGLTCPSYASPHCVDTMCRCLTDTGTACHDTDDCKDAHHGNEHCGHDMKWHCRFQTCHCEHDD